MADLYLYDDVPVLRNSLGIKDENTLDRIEAEQSRANMMLLYERGFHDFTPSGLCETTIFFLAIYMIGLANTALSTLKSVSDC